MDFPKLLLVCVLGLSVVACTKAPKEKATLGAAQAAYEHGQYDIALVQLKNLIQANPDDAKVRVLIAKSFLKLNNPMEAERNFRKALALGVNKNDVVLSLGEALLKQRRFQALIDEVQFTGNLTTLPPSDLAEQLALQGQAYLGLGNKESASQDFQQALALVPDHIRAQLGMAGLSMVKGETDKARSEIQTVIKAAPHSYEAWVLLGDLERLGNHLPEADKAYTEAIANSTPGSFEQSLTYLYRALVRAFNDKYDDAKADLVLARNGASGPNGYVDYITGLIEFKRKDYKSAQSAFESVLRVMPDHTLAQYFLGATHFLEGHPEQAREQLLKFQDKFPDHKEANKMLAVIDLNLKNDEKASERLKALLERDPNDTDALNLLAQYYIQSGDLQHGLETFKKALSINPALPNTQLRTGIAAIATGDLAQAEDAFNEALTYDQNSKQAEFFKFVAEMKKGNYTAALEQAKHYQTKYSNESLGFNLEALVQQMQGHSAEAIQLFQSVISRFPGDPTAVANLVQDAYKKKDFKNAESLLKASIQEHPFFVRNYLKLAKLYFKLNRDEEALTQLKIAREKDPALLQPVLALAEYDLAHQQSNLALSMLLDVRSLHGHIPSYLTVLGKAYVDQDQLSQAHEILNQLKGLTTTEQNTLVLELQALIAYKEKNWALAKTNYEKLLSQKKSSHWVVNLAQVMWAAGDQSGSIHALQTWIEKHPSDQISRMLLADYLMKVGRLDDAKAQYQAVLEQAPDHGLALNNLAWILKDKDPKQAKAFADKALSLHPNDKNIQDTLSHIKA